MLKKYCAVIGLAGVMMSAAMSEEQAANPAWSKLDPAWSRIGAQVEAQLGKQGQRVFIDLAYSSVVVEMCQGFQLDEQKFKNGFSVIETERYKGLTPEQQKDFERDVAMFYGTYRGLLTAEGLLDTPSFCSAASNLRQSGQIPFWMPAS